MEKINSAVKYIRSKTNFVPKIALVLGSGLNDFASELTIVEEISYTDIPGFPVSTVVGHDGRFIFGYLDNVPVVVMKGRVHYYEGYPMSDVVLPIRVMKLLGAQVLFLTNAAGGINYDFKPGTLMMVTDHIATFIPIPLIGKNIDELGTRFPDMSETYDLDLQDIIRETATQVNVDLKEGVYLQFSGPTYETPAEIRMMRTLGADAVGMSTACEAIAGNHMKMKICAISCITNLAAGMSKQKLNHEEVSATANKVKNEFTRLVKQAIINIDKNV
ncbi:MAG: purine-nucleoside phosphorylase [Erysipelotrichaceae bacterium]